jgi:RHS repeat-associated protein
VTVTTGSEVVTLTNGFSVTPAPTLQSIAPSSGQQGQALTGVQVVGANTHFASGTTTVSFANSGITPSAVTVTDATHLTVTATIGIAAATGAGNVTVTTGTEVVTLANGFTVAAGTPAVSAISPTNGQQGQVLTGVQIAGQFTHFAAGTSAVSFGNTGVTASAVTVTDATHLTATLTIAAGAATGATSVTVTTGAEVATVSAAFTVAAGTSVVSTISPATGQQGQVLTGVQITGQFTHFAAGTSAVTFGNTGVTASAVTVTDATHLTATVTIAAGAATGATSVTVTTGAEAAAASAAFTVTAGTPVVSAISPATGQQGQVLTGVQITGQFTHFAAGTSAVTFGNTGVTASAVTVTDATHFTATVTIAAGAATGATSVTVTTGAEAATASAAFTVTAGTPVVSTISPATGQQGQVLTGVQFTGQFTHFAAGTSALSFGNTGVTASAVTVTDATHLTATVTIASGAATGASSVTVTTGPEVATTAGVFTVTAGTPASTPAFSPAAGTYSSAQTVVISSATSGASIRYTMDGSTPTETAGTLYSGPVTVSSTTTIKAIAYASGYIPSAVASALYTLPLSVSVTPATVTLSNGQTQTFAATVTNTANQAVTWSITPSGIGSIDQATGIYTAPATIATQQTITITATSQVDNTKSASASVTLSPGVTVNLSPQTGTLSAGQTLQFTATVQNNANTAVTWSISPSGLGSISSTGVYTAPLLISNQQSVMVTATSVADTRQSASASLTLAIGSFLPIRVNAGGPAVVDQQGLYWSASNGFTDISGNGLNFFSFAPPAGSNVPVVYQTGIAGGTFQYQANVPNGQYVVTLKFADGMWSAGSDVFDVRINGTSVLSNLNLASTVGQYMPWDATFPANVTNGQITIVFDHRSWYSVINAIQIAAATSLEVEPYNPGLSPQQAMQFTATVRGNSSQAVNWSLSPNIGTISPSGLYTAPSSLATPTQVTVTARSVADPTIVGVSTISLSSSPVSSFVPIRVNAGGPAYTDPQGNFWSASNGFTDISGNGLTPFSFAPPAGSNVPVVYQTGIAGRTFQYQANVPNGQYLVTLKFADGMWTAGSDVFDVSINGVNVLWSLNPGSSFGQYVPWDATFPVNVTNGQITILFANRSWYSVINAIQILATGAVEVHPTSAVPWPSQTVQFSASVADTTNQNVTWSIAPTGFGTLSASGLYTAPAAVSSPKTLTVTATAAAPPNLSGSATITLWPPAGVTVTPGTSSVSGGQTKQLTGTPNNGSNLGVTWSISPAGMGSISAAGLYTAPPTVYANQTVTVTATSVADGSTGIATINLVPAVSLTVAPASATLGPSERQQFTANISGAWNSSVAWSISPANAGSITAAGVYIAPSSISGTSTVTITATSTVDPTKTGTATVTLSPAQTGVSITVTPATASLGFRQTQQFSATVSGTGNTAVNWTVTPNLGSISSTGLYTAPANLTTPQNVTIQAASAAYPTVSGSAAITLSPAASYSYRRGIVIDHTKVVNTDQSNFVVSISGTYSYLASTANGGKVQNAGGYDIVFSSDCAGAQKLDHEIISYNPATGAVSFSVLLPGLSHTADTVFYISYGNSTITASQENRASVDAANAASHSADWAATAANNQSSPATFYTIYPENANSVSPVSQTLTSGQTQQFTPVFTVGALASAGTPLTLLGSLPTPSRAESFAINGNLVYVCDDNEISLLDISNPAQPAFLAGILNATINNSGNIHCSIQNNKLIAFVDGIGSQSGAPAAPSMLAFDLGANPQLPPVTQNSTIGARYSREPIYSASGNIAYVPTGYVQFTLGGDVAGAYGQLFTVNAATFSSTPVGALLGNPPDPTLATGPQMGFVLDAVLPNPQTIYAVGSNDPQSWINWNHGQGRLVVGDVTNPAAMSIVTEVDVPGTIDLHAIAIQNNVAVAIGDNGGISGTSYAGFQGNTVIVTFDISSPRNPKILATITTAYKAGGGGPKAQIGNNLFLFGGVRDQSNHDLMLLVDITNPLNPVITPYSVPAPVTKMAVSGQYLHVTAGAAGYAIYQIPGITATQYGLSASCNGPFTWSLNPATGAGTLSASGFYSAPASILTNQSAQVTAASVVDATQLASASVALSSALTLSLAPAGPGPYIVGAPANFVATASTPGGPVSGVTVTFTVTGANPRTATATTDAAGHATLSYTGTVRGLDTAIQAAANGATSNSLSAAWVNPATLVTTTQVSGQFFPATTCASGCEAFNTPSTQVPTFLQNFPNVMFDAGARPFTDTVLNSAGNSAGTVIAQNPGAQAGVGSLAGFAAVLRANFVVKQAGNYTFNLTSADGFLFGIGNGAVRVSGINVNPPASGTTVFSSLPLMAANNGPTTGAAMPIVVNFPAAGSYTYEIDYRSGTGGALSLTDAIRPLESLVLTATGSGSLIAGQSATFNAQATDETGAPIASFPVTFAVTGANQQSQTVNTDSTGHATFTYAGSVVGADVVQATATLNGLGLISNQSPVTWISANAPYITVSGDTVLQLPNPGHYTATITNHGTGLTIAWTKVSGPGNVTFDTPTQVSTAALFDAPGSYVLQIAATDSAGSNSLTVPVTVQPPVTTEQGWILSPLDGAHVTGIVPITLIPGKTLVSGTLTIASASNLSAPTTLNPNTTGSGTIGQLDTTTLMNGAYWIQLNATDNTGKYMGSGIWVNVIGDYKPGRVTTTVTDLVVPAPGLPIQISRTYDSLTRAIIGDFGYGWSLGIKVQMEIANTQDVTFTINGQRRTFYFTPPGNILLATTPAYTAEPGFYGTLTSSASNCGSGISNLVIKTGNIWVCAIGYALYQPSALVYTDPYGRVYTVDGSGNLNSIRDVAGNTLTVTAAGISASNGLSVPFVRDTQGRITQITDPLGNHYTYTYDASGNLGTVAYPGVASPASYTYDPTHLYTGGTDPRGNPFPATTYDTAGRLQSVAVKPDAGTTYTTSYVYDTITPVTVTYPDASTATGFKTTVTYPDASTSVMVYDQYGKLISSTDGLQHTTRNKYDANHNLVAVTDPLGHTTTYGYDANGNRTSVTYPTTPTSLNTTNTTTYNAYGEPVQTTDENGNVRTFNYDANFWPKLASDSIGPVVSFTFNTNGTMTSKAVGYDLSVTSGKATIYTYDQYGNLTGETDALGRQTTYVYDTLGRKTSMTAPGGGTTTYTYDALGNLTAVAAPLGRNTSYTYDSNNNKASETDANNHTTNYEYDGLNRLKKVTYPTTPPTTTQYTYDFRNSVIDTIDQAGHTTHNVYDSASRLTSATQAFGTADAATTSYTYYNDGRKATETDALSHTTTYNYDAAGRLTSTVDAQSHTTAYVYDDAGNQKKVTDPNNHITQSDYDARRRLQKTTYDDATTTQYAYDGPGNLASVTDQAGKVVQYTYDAANQLQSVIQTAHPDPAHNTTLYGYDPKGNLSTLTDANTHTTQNAFDSLGQLKTETMPMGQTQTRLYDAAGNLTSLTDYNGHTTTYTYDTQNRLLSKIPDPALSEQTVSFTYTPTGKRASMIDASGTTTYTYDNLDRLKTKATPQGTLSYTYDAAGNVASMNSSNTNGISVSYTYDSLNRLSTVVDNNLPLGHNTTTYGYDPASNVATVMYPNGLSSSFTYDTLNRMTDTNGYHYQLGPIGNRQYGTEPGGRRADWSYDGIYRLTNETISLDPHSNNGSVSYGLDPVGNRLSQNSSMPGILTGSAAFDANDRPSTESYDNNGNTSVSGARSFAYDFENRLKSMTMSGSPTVTLQYDGDGNRVTKTVGGVTTRYLVNDMNPTGYAQVVEEVVGGAVQRSYTYGKQHISQNQLINSTWTPSFYGYDGFSNVRQLTSSTGTITDTYDYDAWGNAVNTAGTTPNAYLYRGEQYDLDLSLYYLRARYFNPLTGRFLSRDAEDGQAVEPRTLHKYLYAADDPVNRLDPSGRSNLVNYTLGVLGVAITANGLYKIHACLGSVQAPLNDTLKRAEDAAKGKTGTAGPLAPPPGKSLAKCIGDALVSFWKPFWMP